MKDKNIKLSWIPRFSPPGSAASKKRLNKPVLILFALAIIFAILGFIDLKVNAAESDTYEVITYQTEYVYENGDTKDGYPKVEEYYTFSSTSPIDIYVYDSHSAPYTGTGIESFIYAVSTTPFTGKWYSTTESTEYTIDGKKIYVISIHGSTGFGSPLSGYIETSFEGDYRKGARLNVDYTRDEFVQHYVNNTLDSEQIIDYDSLKIDDSMPYPYNFKLNKVVDESESFDIIYDYITWNSDFDYDIQVDVRPYAYIYENKKLGFDYGNLVDFKDWGEAFITDIVPGQSNKYIFEVFDSESYYPEMDYISEFMEFYHSVSLEYPDGTFTDYHNYYSVGYRFRYIDIANNKAGPWVVVEPDRKNLGGFCSYVWFSDGNFTSDVNSTGSNNIFNDGDLDNALINIDKENQFKDKYDVVDNETDVLEATNWLKSVVGFIKSTPSMVGSVLGFLPQPILYGIYLVIFLGVISAGFAIIRALI